MGGEGDGGWVQQGPQTHCNLQPGYSNTTFVSQQLATRPRRSENALAHARRVTHRVAGWLARIREIT